MVPESTQDQSAEFRIVVIMWRTIFAMLVAESSLKSSDYCSLMLEMLKCPKTPLGSKADHTQAKRLSEPRTY